jgi:spermidine/putrescine-binding protein
MSGWERSLYDVQTRRRFLKSAGLTTVTIGAGPAFLAACGGSDESSTNEGSATTLKVSGDVDFLSWEGYDLPKPMASWKRENDVAVRPTYIASNDDIPAKLARGSSAFDLSSAYQGNVDYYEELGILQPIDEDRIPNLAKLYPAFRDMEFFVIDNKRYGVPFTWGSTVLNYDPKFTGEPTSWFDLLEPKFSGKVLVVDDPTVNMQLAGHLLGFDVPNYTEAQFEEVKTLLRKFIAQTKAVSPTYGDVTQAFVSGEGAAFFCGWSAVDLFAADAGKKIKSTLPKEGSFSFCDGWTIPSDADNADAALAFANASLQDKVQADAAVSLSGGVVTPGAVPLLPDNFAELYPYEDLDALLAKAPFYMVAPRESDQFVTYEGWLKAWQELKSRA